MLQSIYVRIILNRPRTVLIVLLLIAAFFAWRAPRFELDASSESLVLENDKDLRFYMLTRRQYPSDDYLVVTFTPATDLFDRATLATLDGLTGELRALDRVSSVFSILDAPLFQSPKVPLFALASGYQTLRKETVDIGLARKELAESPLFGEFLISADSKTTAILVNYERDAELQDLTHRRDDLRAKKHDSGLSAEEAAELDRVSADQRRRYSERAVVWRGDVEAVRAVLRRYEDRADLFLGGIPMIVADMIRYVQSDLVVFGLGVGVFLILMLTVIFRKPRWVLLPMATCLLVCVIMIGLLGWLDWRATVISSNFISLLLIITMSMAIHLVVRYRELQRENPDASHRDLVERASCLVALPCFYCAVTTMVGFGSLYFSGIRPVIDFGKMMSIGIGVAYVLCFTFLPAMLMLLSKTPLRQGRRSSFSLTLLLAKITQRWGALVLALSVVFTVVCLLGVARLSVENKFIDYFKKSTEIHAGMEVIDQKLGGTTPLEIIIDGEGPGYWLQMENLASLRKVHRYLADMPESGKVLSLDTLIQVIERINDGQPVNAGLLNLVRTFLPPDLKKDILTPYLSEDLNQVRIVVRVRESYPGLKREALLKEVRSFLNETMALDPQKVKITGMHVLYNNMLQSLFESQISTIVVVFIVTWIMFLILFRSPKLATIGIVPNILPVVLVLGVLGWLDIPLDMMTITIAAITIGIAVDHTIHYIHRFQAEFAEDGDYWATVRRCHGSIGNAMYYTSITIIAGFSILSLSNFIPTIYFGLFTGLAMTVALLGAMTLLPKLLVLFKSLGPPRNGGSPAL